MAKRVVVKEHRRKVNVTKKNPDGYTIVDRHERNIVGRYLIPEDLESIFKLYDKKKIKYPTANKLNDLRKSEIAIPMAIRWLIYKKKLANKKLGRESSYEEAILEYEGLLKSSSGYKKSSLNNFRKNYELLNK